MPLAKAPPSTNRLLAALPAEEHERLVPHLRKVNLKFGQTLYGTEAIIEDVYFPVNSVFSLLCASDARVTVEVGTVGNEGMVGLPAVLGVSATFIMPSFKHRAKPCK